MAFSLRLAFFAVSRMYSLHNLISSAVIASRLLERNFVAVSGYRKIKLAVFETVKQRL